MKNDILKVDIDFDWTVTWFKFQSVQNNLKVKTDFPV